MAQAGLVFISGGVRSGKSTFAEQLAIEQARKWQGNLHYVACGIDTDHEMFVRIQHHQEIRSKSSIPWKTWERPVDLLGIANRFTKQDIVLIDCLTTLLSNELFLPSHDEDIISSSGGRKQAIVQGVKQIGRNSLLTIVVSNELFAEPVSTEPLTFIYTKLLGQLHQELVAASNYAYIVESGIPIVMKGEGIE